MPPPQEIVDLIERFAKNIEAYKAGGYNETQVRHEFIDPFFIALGWDVNNTKGHANAYKDVIHEDAIKIGSALKAPDYCFRIGGTRKFFIEAKKPSIDIKGDPGSAFQLRRYAWSAKLPLSILTDFEEFAVYDCRIRPKKTDRASAARIKYIKYTEYPECWDEIVSIFSPDAILKGSFDKYAQSTKRKRGTAEVDAAFLAEIERWRENLAKNIALRNAELTNRELNFAVQKTIDRIIFLRIAEDRGLERYGELLGLCNGGDVYARLLGLFRKADDRYNSGLFHFQREKERPEGPDELTPALTVDDAVVKDIFKTLYYPDSPYEFSVLPAEILGHVYEQFLGKVITKTPAGRRVNIEEKPEVKKAGGVYYTPAYIVDYIVENTVGKLLASRTVKHFKTRLPRMDPPLTICDPACGSGSFLLGAYKYLLEWYLTYYTENNPDQWLKATDPPIAETTAPAGAALAGSHVNHKLTVAERKRILLEHIYGVDIDTQAVEVTKLSLLLKVLEGEKSQTLFATERALPDLANNIKCGNSLIGSDFYQNQQMLMFDEEQTLKINAFDWKSEFPQIFNTKKPGFDAVIGNPPYGAHLTQEQRRFFHQAFACTSTDTAALFVEKSLNMLARKGLLGFIIPKPFVYASNWRQLRQMTVPALQLLADVSKVWREVKLEQCIAIFSRDNPTTEYSCAVRKGHTITPIGTIHKSLVEDFGFILHSVSQPELAIAKRMKDTCIPLSQVATNRRGGMLQSHVGPVGSHIVLGGRNIQRWTVRPAESAWIDSSSIDDEKALVTPDAVLAQNIVAHIQNPIDHIKITATILPKDACSQYVILDTINQLICSPSLHPKLLCALLNSKLVNWYSYRFLFAKAIRTMHFDATTTNRLLIPSPAALSSELSVRVIETATHLLDLHTELSLLKTPESQPRVLRLIDFCTQQIDTLIYSLYSLSDKEIDVVEKGMP